MGVECPPDTEKRGRSRSGGKDQGDAFPVGQRKPSGFQATDQRDQKPRIAIINEITILYLISLKIKRLSLLEGAKQATGLAIVIDVFRAFTTGAYVMANGAEAIYPVATVEEAFELKRQHHDWILMGERDGKQVPGFDFGNSPYDVKDVDFTGYSVIQTTSAGTNGLYNAYEADEVLPGSFVMADAIVEYVNNRNPEEVSIVAMGWTGREKSPEDESLGDYIEQKLNGVEPDFEAMKRRIREHPEGAKFFDKNQTVFKEGDFHCAMELNRFDFCLKLVKAEQPYMVKA